MIALNGVPRVGHDDHVPEARRRPRECGGVIVVDDAGHTIGAIGIAGDTSDNDEICALAGIAAAGLKAQS